jgi:hypothetical protein
MEEKEKPEQESIANRLRDLDNKFFCFYKRQLWAIGQASNVLVMREQVKCSCSDHLFSFTYYFN